MRRTSALVFAILSSGVLATAGAQSLAQLPIGARVRFTDDAHPEWRVAQVVARDSSGVRVQPEVATDPPMRLDATHVVQLEEWHRGLGSRDRLMLIGAAVGGLAAVAWPMGALYECTKSAAAGGPHFCYVDRLAAALLIPVGVAGGVTIGWLLPASEWRRVPVN